MAPDTLVHSLGRISPHIPILHFSPVLSFRRPSFSGSLVLTHRSHRRISPVSIALADIPMLAIILPHQTDNDNGLTLVNVLIV